MTPPSPLQAPERSAGSAPPAPSAGSAVSFVFDGSLRKLRSLWTPSFVFDGSLRKLRSLPPPRRLRGAGTLRRLRSTGALRRLRGVVNVDGSLRKLRSLADDRVHVVDELLRRDGQLEQLHDVVQQRLGGGRAECLVPRLGHRAVGGDVVDERDEVGVLVGGQLLLRAGQDRHRAGADPVLDLLLVEDAGGEELLGDLLLLRGGLRGDGQVLAGVADT